MNELFKFAPSNNIDEKTGKKRWKILIADDDRDVHAITKATLKNFSFENIKLEFYDAYSEDDSMKLLSKHSDIAVVLLDVVMDRDDAGLRVAKRVRQELKNKLVRLILRTGQPGSAPEEEVIINYDINDYKEKSELSSRKLFTTLYTALRSYRDLNKLEQNRLGLEKIIEYSNALFEQKSLKEFSSGVLQQLSSFIQDSENGAIFVCCTNGCNNRDIKILASTNKELEKMDESLMKRLTTAIEKKSDHRGNGYYIGYYNLRDYYPHLVYLDNINVKALKEQKHLINLFAKNISIAFENVYLHQDLLCIQSELIYSLGTLSENRSNETGKHIRRVSYGSELLAKIHGLTQDEQNIIKLASPMHDVGKIGISDDILLKPGKLTDDEFEIMKTHSTLGHELFKDSSHRILQVASKIALSHHENYDGTGYPNQISKEEIPICARIVSIIDVFDALTHNRCYKDAWEIDDALEFIKSNSGKKFDPVLVALFIDNFNMFANKYKDMI